MKRTSSEMTNEQQQPKNVVQSSGASSRINSVGFLSQIADDDEGMAKLCNNNSNGTRSPRKTSYGVPRKSDGLSSSLSSSFPKYPHSTLAMNAENSNLAATENWENLENLPDQAVILERLVRIREYKQQVLDTIDKLKNNSGEIDRNLLTKLIKAYDNFKEQEEQYLLILQKVLAIKQQYTMRLAAESSSLSELSDRSDHTPLPSFSANLAAEDSNVRGSSRQSVVPKSTTHDSQMLRNVGVYCQSSSNQKRRNSDFATFESKENKVQVDQSTAFLMKSQELEALKDKLETLRTLCDLTSEEMINETSNGESQETSLKSKLKVLKDNKKRVDGLLNCIDNVDEVIDNTNDSPSVVVDMSSSAQANLRNSHAKPPTSSSPLSNERNQKSTNETAFVANVESIQQTSDLMQQKFDELTATKNRLAKLQQLMGHLQSNVDVVNVAQSSKPTNIIVNNNSINSSTMVKNADIFAAENGDESENDVANIAALSFRMRSAYETKLNEQQQAVQNLQAEHERLMAIKNQLMTLSKVQPGLAIGQPNEPAAAATELVWRNLHQQNAIQQEQQQRYDLSTSVARRSRSRPSTDNQQLNNVKEHVSDHSNLTRLKSRVNENIPSEFGSLDHDDSLNEDLQTNSLTSTIVNNPRLPSFRRNNQLDNAAETTRRGNPVKRSDDGGPLPPSTPRRTSLGSCGPQEYRRSDSRERERCFGNSLEQQYLQLQQHIDSIRSIFQQLMKDHNGGVNAPPNFPPPLNAQTTQQTLFDAAAKLLAQQQNPWDHLYSSLSPSSLAVQQQQLMVSLFSCQQQLQLQQMEMRYLQQMCQDLLTARRPPMAPENTADVYQRSRSASLVHPSTAAPGSATTTNIQPPLGVNLPILDGRPLSTASLYNLLAPNPYLTFPYYASPQHFRQTFPANEQQQQQQSKFGQNNGNYRTIVQPYASSSPRYQKLYADRTQHQQQTSMSQSLIEHGSERVFGDGDVNSKLMTMSDSARAMANLPDAANAAGYSKSNATKKQKNYGAQDYDDVVANQQRHGFVNYDTSETTLTSDQFDALREMIYSEVATLISQNEQRPHFLLELFRELQLLSSDYLRTRALQAIRNVLNRYLVDENEQNQMSRRLRSDAGTQSVVEETQTDSPGTSDYDDFKQTTMKPYLVASELGRLKEDVPLSNEIVADEVILADEGLVEHKKEEPEIEVDVKLQESSGVNAKPPANQKNIQSSQSSSSVNAETSTTNVSRSGSKANVDVGGLEQQIQNVVDELIPVLKDNVDSVCNSQLLQYLRKLVISLALSKCLPSGTVNTFFQRQLSSILDDTLAKFQGQKLQDCGEELLGDVSEVVFNELAFFRLMQNIDSVDNEPRKSDADESEDNLVHIGHETTTEPEDGSESERSSVQPSSPEIVAEEMAAEELAGQDISEISEDIDVSAVTTISPSKESVKVNSEEKAASSDEIVQTERASRRQSGDATKAVEVVLTTPLTVQVTAATDEDENSTSESASMHTAGIQPFESMTDAFEHLEKQTSADSRETSPPDELLDAEEIPENIGTGEEEVVVGQERETTTFDLDFEPHPEDKLQLTIDSVEFRNLQNQLNIPDEVEEEDEDQQQVTPIVDAADVELKVNSADNVQACGAD